MPLADGLGVAQILRRLLLLQRLRLHARRATSAIAIKPPQFSVFTIAHEAPLRNFPLGKGLLGFNYFNRVYSRVGFSSRIFLATPGANSLRPAVKLTVCGNLPSKCG